MKSVKSIGIIFGLVILLILSFFLDIIYGSISIPFNEVWSSIFYGTASKNSWIFIVQEYRLPKAIAAILVGMGLSVSGLFMQTLFRNPLAGPYVLGLTSGSSLGVAFLIMGAGLIPGIAGLLSSSIGITLASCIGCALVLLAVILVGNRLRDTNGILIVGLMFSSFSSAIVGILSWFGNAEQLQKFTFWSMGNLGNLSWQSLGILGFCTFLGLLISLFCIKSLDALLLGENYARSLGVPIKTTRNLILIATSILAGSITAFAGPIAFIGLAVPHFCRMLFKTSKHAILFIGCMLCGAILMLLCDLISQWPNSDVILPINAITSLIGAPVVIGLILKKRKNSQV